MTVTQNAHTYIRAVYAPATPNRLLFEHDHTTDAMKLMAMHSNFPPMISNTTLRSDLKHSRELAMQNNKKQ